MLLNFAKYHGLGNDFAVVDARALDLAFPGALGQKLCDRNRGIGADGVLVWTGSLAQPRMTVVNADGSVAEMCGNGLRCFVKYLLDRHLPQLTALDVDTGNGRLHCAVTRDATGTVATVAVQMGVARDVFAAEIHAVDRDVHLTALNLGNPHAVTFDAIAPLDRLQLGPILGAHPLFPQQANVEFVQILPGDLPRMQVDVYERGCGWTQACGTGATAAAIVAVQSGRMPRNVEIAAQLPGGWLGLTVADDGMATMRGPAVHVFDGAIDLDRLLATDP
jgi:diaminopimelate epimerase